MTVISASKGSCHSHLTLSQASGCIWQPPQFYKLASIKWMIIWDCLLNTVMYWMSYSQSLKVIVYVQYIWEVIFGKFLYSDTITIIHHEAKWSWIVDRTWERNGEMLRKNCEKLHQMYSTFIFLLNYGEIFAILLVWLIMCKWQILFFFVFVLTK